MINKVQYHSTMHEQSHANTQIPCAKRCGQTLVPGIENFGVKSVDCHTGRLSEQTLYLPAQLAQACHATSSAGSSATSASVHCHAGHVTQCFAGHQGWVVGN